MAEGENGHDVSTRAAWNWEALWMRQCLVSTSMYFKIWWIDTPVIPFVTKASIFVSHSCLKNPSSSLWSTFFPIVGRHPYCRSAVSIFQNELFGLICAMFWLSNNIRYERRQFSRSLPVSWNPEIVSVWECADLSSIWLFSLGAITFTLLQECSLFLRQLVEEGGHLQGAFLPDCGHSLHNVPVFLKEIY